MSKFSFGKFSGSLAEGIGKVGSQYVGYLAQEERDERLAKLQARRDKMLFKQNQALAIDQRKFQAGESEKGRTFQAGESEKGRKHTETMTGLKLNAAETRALTKFQDDLEIAQVNATALGNKEEQRHKNNMALQFYKGKQEERAALLAAGKKTDSLISSVDKSAFSNSGILGDKYGDKYEEVRGDPIKRRAVAKEYLAYVGLIAGEAADPVAPPPGVKVNPNDVQSDDTSGTGALPMSIFDNIDANIAAGAGDGGTKPPPKTTPKPVPASIPTEGVPPWQSTKGVPSALAMGNASVTQSDIDAASHILNTKLSAKKAAAAQRKLNSLLKKGISRVGLDTWVEQMIGPGELNAG